VLLCSVAVGCGDSSTRKVNPKSKFLTGLSKWLPGKPLPSEDLAGPCLAAFTERCDVEIRESKARIRRGKLRLVSGLKVTVDFRPKDGSGFHVSLDPTNTEMELAVRKSGGSLTLGCVPAPGGMCAVALVSAS
jgi:hypothetical protein